MAEPLIVNKDTFSPWLQGVLANAPVWKRKSLKSLGWMMQREIKLGIKAGTPGGERYSKSMPAFLRQKIEKIFGNRPKSDYPIFGRMVNAIGYQYQPTSESVETGWLSASAVRIGELLQGGFARNITDNMRYSFWAAGVPLSRDKKQIIVPPRPTIDPMSRILEPKLEPYMTEKIFEYMEKGTPSQASATRKYIVFR